MLLQQRAKSHVYANTLGLKGTFSGWTALLIYSNHYTTWLFFHEYYYFWICLKVMTFSKVVKFDVSINHFILKIHNKFHSTCCQPIWRSSLIWNKQINLQTLLKSWLNVTCLTLRCSKNIHWKVSWPAGLLHHAEVT